MGDLTFLRRVAVVMPVLDDWASMERLIENMEAMRRAHAPRLCLVYVAVDDGSSQPFERAAHLACAGAEIRVVRLKANLGHQRAIALGLTHVERDGGFDAALVMDSDGEDRPEDALRLLAQADANPGAVVCALRARRSEGPVFRLCYLLYRAAFLFLVGRPIRFGNFSVIGAERLPNVLYSHGIWNNLAATLLRCRVPIKFVETQRGERYFGASRMNFVGLVLHGISVVSVFSDVVIARIVIALVTLLAILGLGIAVTFAVKLGTDTFIPGYATNVILFLANMIVTSLFIGFAVVMQLLNTRATAASLPSRLFDDLVRAIDEFSAHAPRMTIEAAE